LGRWGREWGRRGTASFRVKGLQAAEILPIRADRGGLGFTWEEK